MKKCKLSLLWVFCFCLLSSLSVYAQTTQTTLPIAAHGTINFSKLAQQEFLNPPPARRLTDVEDKDDNLKGIIRYHKVAANATVTRIALPNPKSSPEAVLATSPAPLASFNGLIDNNTEVPPDVMGVAGPNYLFETINSQYEIFNKSGSSVSTLSLASFWSGVSSSGAPFCDPHTEYDATSGHWFSVLLANLSNGDYGIFVAVSQTSDPTGTWNEYSIDPGSKTTLPDYPMMGYSSTWVAITVNNFANGTTFSNVGIFMMSKASLISGTIGTVTKTTDANLFAVSPAQTMDPSVSTIYMLSDFNGNSGGNGFVELCTITGTTTPVYAEAGQIGINQPWSETVVNAKQKGTSNAIATDDTRMHDVYYRNGSLWGAQNAYLPSTSPTRCSVQWWQINPTNSTVTQFGRVDDATGVNFYYYPAIAIDANNDVLLGYTNSSTNIFASGAYSYHAASDAAGTMESQDIYTAGLASYFKTLGGSSNRWGDFSASSIDPNDGSFWTLQEFAYTPANTWGTTWAHIAGGGATCNAPTGMATSAIADNSATFTWTAVTGAASYNVQYRIAGTTTWSTANTTIASYNATGLTAGSNYEWQVQTVCSAGGNSSFTASTNFTTTGTAPCNTPTGEATTSITSTSATFSWTAVSNAASYNVQYRVVGAGSWTAANTTATSYSATGLSVSTNYEWQVQTACTGGGTSAFSASTNFTTTAVTYCTSVGGKLDGITNVTFNTINNNSSGTTSGYTNYSGTISTTVNRNQAYTLSVLINTGGNYTNYAKAWIDWNHDGTFSTTTEEYTLGTATNVTNGKTTLSPLSITVPAGAVLGTTRMRVSTQYNANPTPCNASFDGEVEDYGVVVATGAVCNTPTGMTTNPIADNSATFNWTAVTGAASYNVQYRKAGTGTWSTANTTTASYAASGLTAGTNYEWQVQTACSGGGTSSFTASTNFTTTGTPPCNTPTGMATGSITTTSATFTWTAVSGATGYNIQYRVVGTGTWSTGTSTLASFSASGLTANTNYEWQVQTVCSGGGTSSFTASTAFTTLSTISYCTSSGTTTYEYINNVTLGTINNTSGNNSGYGNYTSLSANLTAGTANSIKLTPGFVGTKYAEYWTVYIDYNHDGVLNGTGEQVAQAHSTSNGAAVSVSFTVPTTAKNGATRLRVQMHYGSYSTNPCAILDFGEVEDYSVTITGGANVSQSGLSSFTSGISRLELYPNPAQNELNMLFTSDANYNSVVSVYNSIGQKVMSIPQNVAQGRNLLQLSALALSSGLYVLEIESNGQRIMQKFNVQK